MTPTAGARTTFRGFTPEAIQFLVPDGYAKAAPVFRLLASLG